MSHNSVLLAIRRTIYIYIPDTTRVCECVRDTHSLRATYRFAGKDVQGMNLQSRHVYDDDDDDAITSRVMIITQQGYRTSYLIESQLVGD